MEIDNGTKMEQGVPMEQDVPTEQDVPMEHLVEIRVRVLGMVLDLDVTGISRKWKVDFY